MINKLSTREILLLDFNLAKVAAFHLNWKRNTYLSSYEQNFLEILSTNQYNKACIRIESQPTAQKQNYQLNTGVDFLSELKKSWKKSWGAYF